MASLSFEEGRDEIVSLLKACKEEFDSGNPATGASMLIEAQFVLNELVRNGVEGAVQVLSFPPRADMCCASVCSGIANSAS
jgi:hypothetical protein